MAARRPFWKWCRWKSIDSCLWPPSICIWNFEIEISQQTWLMLRKPCRLQTDGWTDRRTDGQGESSIPPTSLGGGIKMTQLYHLGPVVSLDWCLFSPGVKSTSTGSCQPEAGQHTKIQRQDSGDTYTASQWIYRNNKLVQMAELHKSLNSM